MKNKLFIVRKYSYTINSKFIYGARISNLMIFKGIFYKIFIFILIFAPIIDYLVTCNAINILGINLFLYYENSILKYHIINGEWFIYFIPAYLCNYFMYCIYKDSLKNLLNFYSYITRYIIFWYCFIVISSPFLSWEYLYFRLGY